MEVELRILGLGRLFLRGGSGSHKNRGFAEFFPSEARIHVMVPKKRRFCFYDATVGWISHRVNDVGSDPTSDLQARSLAYDRVASVHIFSTRDDGVFRSHLGTRLEEFAD